MGIKNHIIDRAIRSTSQREAYEERISHYGDLSQGIIERGSVSVLKAREIGWQTLHFAVSLPDIVMGKIVTDDESDRIS